MEYIILFINCHRNLDILCNKLREIPRVTFRDEEAGRVEGDSCCSGGVNHPRFVDPLKGAFLRMPLNSIEWIPVGWKQPETLSAHLTHALRHYSQY